MVDLHSRTHAMVTQKNENCANPHIGMAARKFSALGKEKEEEGGWK